MCEKLGVPHLHEDPRFESNNVRVKNRDKLERMIEDITKTKTTQKWLEIFDGSGVPYAAINDIQTTLHHEHGECLKFSCSFLLLNAYAPVVVARNMVTEVEHSACGPMKLVSPPVKYSYSKPSIRSAPPTLGQHTDEILQDLLGMSGQQVEDLQAEGVVA
jgi:succinate--hydroxymethylglutarate CoA-transferase